MVVCPEEAVRCQSSQAQAVALPDAASGEDDARYRIELVTGEAAYVTLTTVPRES